MTLCSNIQLNFSAKIESLISSLHYLNYNGILDNENSIFVVKIPVECLF